MNTRNIFVVVVLALVVALFFYLLEGMGTKQESAVAEHSAVEQVAPSEAAPDSSVGNAQLGSETDAKLEELKRQQGAVSSSGLSLMYLVKCSACHGRDGRGPVGSPIVGKTKEENMAILMKYKMKQVPNSAMLGLLEQTSNEELEKLAEEISAF
jgi:cytochrome c553